MLKVNQLSYQKNGADLLRDVSLQIKAGEILAVVGPNGAGKTTLLKALMGDIHVKKGSIEFAQRDIKQWPLAKRAQHIALLPQLSLLNFPYTVDEVVALGRTPHSTGIAIDQAVVQEAMSVMDITYLSGRLYTQLSGGEKQRTQLARVMAQIWRAEDADPRLLILDEPTNSLDLGHKQQLMQAVQTFAADGAAVIMVEHDLTIVGNYAHSLLALQCGQSVAYGPIDEVLNQEMVQNLFGANVHLWVDPESGRKGMSL